MLTAKKANCDGIEIEWEGFFPIVADVTDVTQEMLHIL